ncbi:hypothetical protein BC832DRAFT_148244 [Gaertneriomyces semiglobifer]|nr:hypothetical protein BC832DRAFT_148244 [Gaertneriomyces semiglobifer]
MQGIGTPRVAGASVLSGHLLVSHACAGITTTSDPRCSNQPYREGTMSPFEVSKSGEQLCLFFAIYWWPSCCCRSFILNDFR